PPQILHVHLARTRLQRAPTDLLEILLLTHIRDVGDHLVPTLLQHLQDAGGAEAATVRENHFLGCHLSLRSPGTSMESAARRQRGENISRRMNNVTPRESARPGGA